MILKNYYYYHVNAIPHSLCDDIIKEGKRIGVTSGLIGGVVDDKTLKRTKDDKELHKKRKSLVSFFSEPWVYKELHPFIHAANNDAGWRFQWDHSEAVQYTEYNVGEYYGWHADSWEEPYKDNKTPAYNGRIRKLSMTLSLTNPEEYDGGNLEFDFRNDTDYENDKTSKRLCTEIRPKGSMIVFPSFVWHRVTPVTRGLRQSLVMWSLGKPFV